MFEHLEMLWMGMINIPNTCGNTHDCETDARGSMTLAIYKSGACTKALIMDIATYQFKLYQSKGYNNYFKVCQPYAAFNPCSEQFRDNN